MAEGSGSEPDPLAAAIKGRPSSALRRALSGRCPRCDSPGLFVGPVKFAGTCRGCGLDFASFNVGDGPAAFLILIVGAIVTGGAIWLELSFSPPGWVHLIWVPVVAGLTIAGLRLAKAILLALEYKHRAAEGRIGR